jgi:hypothetical protein
MIPEDIQKEWDDHLYDWHITLGMPKFLDKTAFNLLELSSIFSSYALYITAEQYSPVRGGAQALNIRIGIIFNMGIILSRRACNNKKF